MAVKSALASPLPAPVPRAIVSADSARGTAADAWAGYTGALKIWVPAAVTGGWTLSFRSAALGQQAPANSVRSIGFNGNGVLSTAFALEDCVVNGQPCVAAVMSAADSQATQAGLQAGNGVNDVSHELFSLADSDAMIAWAKANGLAGIHFWSVDRDTPCSQASASPTCNSVPSAPVWSWTQRFIQDLGL